MAPRLSREAAGADANWPADVQIVRSERRRRTLSARVDGDVVIIQAPARMTPADEQRLIATLVERLRKARLRQELNRGQSLEERAVAINSRYFGGRLRWASIAYVTDMERRLGSCTRGAATIRISHHLATVPEWVSDYVIMHELTHLLHPNHSRAFWAEANRYRLAERARGYLMALDFQGDEDDAEL